MTVLAVGVALLELGLGGTVASIVGAGASFALLGAGAVLETMPSRHQRVLVAVMVGWVFALANTPLCPAAIRASPFSIDTFVLWPGVLVALVVLAERVAEVRSGSLVHGSRSRSVCVAVGLALAMLAASLLSRRFLMRSPALGYLVGGAALTALVSAVALDVRALRRIRRARAFDRRRSGTSVLDCGVGDATTEETLDVDASYRHSARAVLVIRGSLPRAALLLRRAAIVHAIALGVAMVALGSGLRPSRVGYLPQSKLFRPCTMTPPSAPALPPR